jgi:uncharacterized protein (DUF302 family)
MQAPRNEFSRRALMGVMVSAAVGTTAQTATAETPFTSLNVTNEETGLVSTESDHSIETTISRLRQAIRDTDDTEELVLVDHTEIAAGVDESLPEARLILVGMPDVERALGEEAPTVGLDVPPGVLIYDGDDAVEIVHNSPEYVATRHGLEEGTEALRTMDERLTEIVEIVNE